MVDQEAAINLIPFFGYMLKPEHIIGLAAAFIALIGTVYSIFNITKGIKTSARVEKSNAYLSIEMNSSQIFKFEAENAHFIDHIRQYQGPLESFEAHLAQLPEGFDKGKAKTLTLNLYFQSLNLFEVAAKFRRQNIISPDIFASWVPWLYDIVNDTYFRLKWDDIRENYTQDIRDIFDAGYMICQESPPDTQRQDFFDAVAGIMGNCSVIKTWPEQVRSYYQWKSETE